MGRGPGGRGYLYISNGILVKEKEEAPRRLRILVDCSIWFLKGGVKAFFPFLARDIIRTDFFYVSLDFEDVSQGFGQILSIERESKS